MIHLITPHSLERTGIPLRINSMSLDMKERESTASLTLDDREGISNKQITGMWFYDDEDPGAGMVWRARSLSESLHTKTPVVQLEHIISTLKDTIIFDEVTPATITGDKNAKTVSAKAAINYILNRQETKDWKLYSFDPSYEEISQGYSFEGDTLYDALVTVCSTLEGCWWQYDTNHYPFRLYILNHTTMPWADTMLRAGRNMRTISVTTDKSGMYTRFWPVGKDDLHLTSSPNYKNDYILSSKASTYGVIDHTETDATLETASDLAAFARARLRKHSAPVVKIEVEGLELQKATMTPEDKIVLGGLCEIVIGETGKKYEEKIIGKSYPDKMNTPEIVKITLSNQQDDVAKIIAQEKKKTAKGSRVQARQSKQTREILYNTVKEVRVDGPTGNNYKLQYKLVKDVDWQDAGTFSRAVTSWVVSAADGTITVTAKPQNQPKDIKVRAGTATRSGKTYTGQIQYSGDNGKNWADAGARYSVDASAIYKNGWAAARGSVDEKTYTYNGKQYAYFPTASVAAADRLSWIYVAKPSATVDGGIDDNNRLRYYVTSGQNTAYIRYGSAVGYVVAEVQHNQYSNGWGAARSSVTGKTYTYNGVVYEYFPTESVAAANRLDWIYVAKPSATVDGGIDDNNRQRYYVTSGNNTAYIRFGSQNGNVVAQIDHNKYDTGWGEALDAITGRTYTYGGKTYEYNPTSGVASADRLDWFYVAKPNATPGSRTINDNNRLRYILTTTNGYARIHYSSTGGAVVAEQELPKPSASNILMYPNGVSEIIRSTSAPSDSTALSSLATILKQAYRNDGGTGQYVRWKATIDGGTGAKWFYVNMG